MENSDYLFWDNFRTGVQNRITKEEYKKVCELHSKYFNHKLKYVCTCKPQAIQKYINDLNELFLKSQTKN